MKRYEAGTIVGPGLYVSARPWSVKPVSRPGLLEGARGAPFVRIPTAALPVVAILALVLGGVWVVLFPLIGAGMIAVSGVHCAYRWIARACVTAAASRPRRARRS